MEIIEMVEIKCFICKTSLTVDKNDNLNRITEYSNTPIKKFILHHLNYNLLNEKKTGICNLCLEDVNILDLYFHKFENLKKALLIKINSIPKEKEIKQDKLKCKNEHSPGEIIQEIERNVGKSLIQEFSEETKEFQTTKEDVDADADKSYKCPLCEKGFKFTSMLKKHLKTIHGKDTLDCCICGATNKNKLALSNHYNKHIGKIGIECEICGKKFTQKRTLLNHMVEHREKKEKEVKSSTINEKEEVPKTFDCSQCDKTFTLISLYKRHLRNTHGKKTFFCNVCNVTLKSRASLYHHNYKHSGSTEFQCKICGKNYTQKVGLTKHMVNHTGEVKYQCDECGRQFKHECTFKYHKATHGNVRTKKCPVCGIEMRINSQLKRHMMTHTGEKPHACPVCDRKFACLYNMKVHLKSHDGIKIVRKKHQCNICLKEFPRKVNLNTHLEAVHETVVESENTQVKEDKSSGTAVT